MKPLSSCFRFFMLHPVSLFIQMNVVYIYGMNRVIFVECQVAIFQLHRGKNKFDFQCQPHLTYYHILTYKLTTVFYSLMMYAQSRSNKYYFNSLQFNLARDRTLDLQHSTQASYLLHRCSSYVGVCKIMLDRNREVGVRNNFV